ncbi:MAG: cytochrome c-type biogenesis protein [Hyphomicrobiales bacterium]
MKGYRLALMAVMIALAGWLVPGDAGAVKPDEMLKDPVLEARARDISTGLRCLVCQNQSIDESNAELARDLRLLVRERLTAGDTDQQVLDYIVARYGVYVLLKPPLTVFTLVLWFAPAGFLLAGLGAVVMLYRRRSHGSDEAPELTPEEEKQLSKLLEPTEKPAG